MAKKKGNLNLNNPKQRELINTFAISEGRVSKQKIFEIGNKELFYRMKSGGFIQETHKGSGVFKSTAKLQRLTERTTGIRYGNGCSNAHSEKIGKLQYEGSVVGDPKKMASVRDIPLTEEACGIIELLIKTNDINKQSDEDFLFVYNNKRIKGNAVLKRLYALCDELEIDRRSTHKIRKTTLSNMLDVCIKQDIADISAIRAVAGHVDESTLLKNYLFSTRKDEMPELISTALTSKSWKHLETFGNNF